MKDTTSLTKKLRERARILRGLQTVDSIVQALRVTRSNAVRIVHELRKRRLAQTISGGRKKRIYRITLAPVQETGGQGLYAYLSRKSRLPLRIATPRIIHAAVTPETALIDALNDDDFRVWLAGAALFRHIQDWTALSKKAVEQNLGRVVGAFYDAARRVIRVRRMPKRVRNRLQKDSPSAKFVLKVPNRDFHDIEEYWKVGIPFSKADLERLK